jgi:PAS domain S-box-containing protein
MPETNGDDMPRKTLGPSWRYVSAVLAVTLATVIRLVLDAFLRDRFPYLVHFAAIVFVAWYSGLGPSILALVLSWLSVDYFVLQPRGSLPILVNRFQFGFAFCIVGVTVILLGELARAAQRRARASAAETRRARERQQADREWLRITLASIAEAVITTDSGGRVISLNPIAEQLTGWRTHEAEGQPLKKVFRTVEESTNRSAELPLSKVVEGAGEVVLEDGKVFIGKDGTERSIEQTAAPIKDDQGNILGVVIVIRDITERRRTEEALREADRRKEEFLAVLSHELRNPLAPIQTALDLMRRSEMSPAQFQRELTVVDRQVRHLTRLVDDLLDVSRINRGRIELHREVVVLASAIANLIESIQPLIDERRIELTLALPAERIRLEADSTRLEQILLNLLTNAIKYTDVGGRIRLSAQRDGDQVVVRVRDTGMGITPDLLPRIFDLFVQGTRRLNQAQGGMGIGLCLVKTLVEQHGGTITAHSAGPGMGSEFVVRLPALPATQHVPSLAPRVAPARVRAGFARHRILIVDDNAAAADGLARLLALVYGQDVRVANDGLTALESAIEFQPEIVLLDLGMAVMDGYEVARLLRERPEGRRMRIVAVTGWGQEEDRRRSREMGFDLHLVKPVKSDTLEELLNGSQGRTRGDGMLTAIAETNHS